MKIIIFINLLVLFIPQLSYGQKRNAIWCFGDSAGIDFNSPNNPVPISTAMDSRGSSASIADTAGHLLFYAYTRAGTAGNTTIVRSWNDSTMVNGNNIVGEGWYHELLIIPYPQNNNMFYLFSNGVTGSSQFGLYYSIIDMSLDSGRGTVVQKNIQLSNHEMFDCFTAIKHGNGRDWWIICRPSNAHGSQVPSNEFYIVQVTPAGVQGPFIQSIGNFYTTDIGTLSFSKSGNKIIFVDYQGLIEIYDFDRCSGVIGNSINIELENVVYPHYFGAAFSPNELVLYVSASWLPSRIFQFDLTAANISSSKQIITSISYPAYAGGFLRLAPDDKIYWSYAWNDGVHFNYPYPDTSIAFNIYNMNLSVINIPDSVGISCDFQPWSFYLGGKRTYWDLPNNPDYSLYALGGSSCDTLGYPNNIQSLKSHAENQLHVFYHPDWQTAFINASGLTGKKYVLHLIDIGGREVFTANGSISSDNFTKDLDCSQFVNGTYVVVLETEMERLVKKFIIQ